MEAFEGIDRGGSKEAVYLPTRLKAQDPTRLFMDANTTQQWRTKQFFSVTQGSIENNRSTLLRMLDLKSSNPFPKGEFRAESEDTMCAKNSDEMDKFESKHPNWGMPFGFPPLKKEEYALIKQWLAQGSSGLSASEQSAITTPSKNAMTHIAKWETFLNQRDAKHQVTARYLYEHFFLAHIHFGENSRREFFELVRSSTPTGQPIVVIPTLRPYDDPKVQRVYYRFRKIHATITHKTHIVVKFDDEKLAQYQKLFIDTPWTEKPHLISYDPKMSANPLVAYAQIPADSRYRFLLTHSQYIVDTFIRGPVCKGQLALNVIEDHFWVMFVDPAYDYGVQHSEFYAQQQNNLSIPDEAGSDASLLDTFSNDYRERYARYYRAKMDKLDIAYPQGLPLDSIWKGWSSEDAPLLTVYRHFDSASVSRGVLGELPKTMWVMDYAQFERTYYALVAGFDVFGNLSHQTNVRRFMDFIRIEGELNFLNYIPKEQRYPLLQSWYIGENELNEVSFDRVKGSFDTPIEYFSQEPKRELIEMVVNNQIARDVNITFDAVNYFHANESFPSMPKKFETREDYLQGFRALTAPGTGFIRELNGYNVDVLYLRIRNTPQGDRFVSMVINRWHDNVSTLFGEKK
jgi:hypothetical protein